MFGNRVFFGSRRELLRALALGSTWRKLFAASPSRAIEQLVGDRPWLKIRMEERRFRAHAVITFCGVTIFSKRDVGSGFAIAEEASRDGVHAIALQFGAGSWPEKAHNVNRFGAIQEIVTEPVNAAPSSGAYFGYMTSSAEKNFDQAKKALNATGAMAPYTSCEGFVQPGRDEFRLYRMMLPRNLKWLDSARIERLVRAKMAVDPPAELAASQRPSSETPGTFLDSVRKAIQNPTARTEGSLVYNGKQYRLLTEKFTEANGSTRLDGTLEPVGSGRQTPFKLWVEDNSGSFLPTRIEYKAKSFLRLIFENDPQASEPPAKPILIKETS